MGNQIKKRLNINKKFTKEILKNNVFNHFSDQENANYTVCIGHILYLISLNDIIQCF